MQSSVRLVARLSGVHVYVCVCVFDLYLLGSGGTCSVIIKVAAIVISHLKNFFLDLVIQLRASSAAL